MKTRLKKRKKLTRAQMIKIFGKGIFKRSTVASRRAAAGRFLALMEKAKPIYGSVDDPQNDKKAWGDHVAKKYG